MYKMLFPLMVLALSNWAFASEAPSQEQFLYKKVISLGEEGNDPKAAILSTFREAIKGKKANKVKDLFDAKAEEIGDGGELYLPTNASLFQIYNGRGGLSQYGSTWIVGTPASYKGSGMIESLDLLFLVRYNVNVGESETVTVEKLMENPND